MTQTLGKLERVDLREVWQSEPQDFTPWLAGEENLAVLAEALNMELELEAREKDVGPFSADILCTNTDDNSLVLIENQLERTDHTHLGQLMTYAAGLHTVNIVWIAAKFTEEHRAAMDWLNEITDVRFRFFGLEVEVWRIGESLAAPKFNIVSKPNDWSRTVSRAARGDGDGALSEIKRQQHAFWQALTRFADERGSRLRFHTPRPQHWINLGVGRTGTQLSGVVNSKTNLITVGFECTGDTGKAFFDLLYPERELIEQDLGFEPVWHRLDDKKASVIWHSIEGDFRDQSQWPEFHLWMIDHLERLDVVFRPRVKAINLDDWVPPEEDEGGGG